MSLIQGPPNHGGRLEFTPCDRIQGQSYQRWVGKGDLLLSGWRPGNSYEETENNLYKVEHNKLTNKVSKSNE